MNEKNQNPIVLDDQTKESIRFKSAFSTPLPGLNQVMEDDPAAQAAETADWDRVKAPTFTPSVPTRGPVDPNKQIAAHSLVNPK